jgi:2-oxoglutarate ferredoxin oxidoreductase subunit gamma
MADRFEIRLSGSGGQGVILAGVILAEAAALWDEKNAVQSQSYGPEARGGASRSEVIISDGDIDYPKATDIDVLLALTQEACERYLGDLKSEGTLIVDSDLVSQVPDGAYRVVRLPIVSTATDELGRPQVANIVSLGSIVELTDVVTKEALTNAVISRVPKGTEDLNRSALEAGYKLVRGLDAKASATEAAGD